MGFDLPCGCERAIGLTSEFGRQKRRVAVLGSPHVCSVARPEQQPQSVGRLGLRQWSGVEHVGASIAKHVRWDTRSGIRESWIVTVAEKLKVGSHPQEIQAGTRVTALQAKKSAVRPTSRGERAPEGASSRRLDRGHDLMRRSALMASAWTTSQVRAWT